MPRFFTQWIEEEASTRDKHFGLTRYDDITPAVLQQHLDVLFPDGVAAHGENNFVSAEARFQVTDHVIELAWENVRRAHFPAAPSRLQSVFAVDGLDEARAFRTAFDLTGTAKIWRLV